MVDKPQIGILSLIKTDHRKVQQLLESLESDRPSENVYGQFNQIYTLLNLHTRAEEAVFYPAIQEHIGTEGLVESAEDEHNDAKVILDELRYLKPETTEFKQKITELKRIFQHHVEVEEAELFAISRDYMTDEELMTLGNQFQQAKEQVREAVELAMVQ